MPAGNINITAEAAPQVYTIQYNLNGGTNNPKNPGNYTIETNSFSLQAPTRTGYTFAGWKTEDLGDNPITFKDDDATRTFTMPHNNVVFTAQWTINQYSITFDVDGGSDVTTITQDYGTPITAPTDPTKEGYTFKRWTPSLPTTMPAENVNVTAVWEINKYHVVLQDTENAELSYVTVPNIDGTFNCGTTIEVSLQVDDGYSFTIDSDDVSLVNK
jgi:uncharacterized repeat protein (TIGR02543 family)